MKGLSRGLLLLPIVIALSACSQPENGNVGGNTSAGSNRVDQPGFPDLKPNEFFVGSVPTDLRCYIVPESEKTQSPPGQNKEYFKEEYFRGKTPIKVSLEPGTYYVVFFVSKDTTPAEWIFGRYELPTVVSWGMQEGSPYVIFRVSKADTAGTFIGLVFDVSLTSDEVDALYLQGNNFSINDRAGLESQLSSRGLGRDEIDTLIGRLTRSGKAVVPLAPGKAAKFAVELKPGGGWEILEQDKR